VHLVDDDLAAKGSLVVLDHELVGVVDEVGEGATWFTVGDRAGVAWLGETCGPCRLWLTF
jgi:propanol-preferring alcohol dehydrogenase